MALSGVYYTDIENGYRLQLEWTGTQNYSANTTTVTAKLFWISLGSQYTISSSSRKSCTITIDGQSSTRPADGMASLSGNQKKLIHQYTRTITHNDDGTRSITLHAYFDIELRISGTYYTRIGIPQKVVALNPIPRESELISSPYWTAGQNLPITISRASTKFVHVVRVNVNDVLIKEVGNIGTSTTIVFTKEENTQIFNQLAQSSEVDARIDLLTFNGSDYIGGWGYLTTCYAPDPSKVENANFNIGEPVEISISKKNDEFIHDLNVYVGNQLIKTITGIKDNVTWTPTQNEIDMMYNTTPNSSTVQSKIECTTYYNEVQVQTPTSKTGTATVTNSSPIFDSNFIYKDTNPDTVTITGNDQHIIQNRSTVTVEIPIDGKATAINGASMVSYVAILNGISITQPYSDVDTVVFNFNTINASTNLTLSIKAIDSRGNSTIATKTVIMLPYSPPSLSISASRTNSFENETTLKASGSFSLLQVEGINKNLIQSLQYRFKDTTSSLWSDWTDITYTTNGTIFEAENVLLDLDNLKAWNIEVRVLDKFSEIKNTYTVAVGQPIFYIDSKKQSIGINKFPDDGVSLDVNGITNLNGTTNINGTINIKDGIGLGNEIKLTSPNNIQHQSVIRVDSGQDREVLQLRAKTDLTDGSAINLYGNNDPSNPGELRIYTSGTTTIGMLPNGNVGIGTSAPQTKLDVRGNTRITGNLELGGSVVSKIQYGSVEVVYSASTRLRADVVFPTAFSKIPIVNATIHWTDSASSVSKMSTLYIESVTLTGFIIQVTNQYGTTFTQNDKIWVDWIAIA